MNKILKISGAIYDQTRITILGFLQKYGECCVCELCESLKLGQSRMSRHLGILQDAGFLSTNRNGKWVYYSIAETQNELVSAALHAIAGISIELPAKVDACNIKGCTK